MARNNYQITLKDRYDLEALYDTIMEDVIPSFIDRVHELFDTDNHRGEELSVHLYAPGNSELAIVSTTLDFFIDGESDEPLFVLSANIEPRYGGPYGSIYYDLMFEGNLSVPTAGIKQKHLTTYVGTNYSDEDFLDLVEPEVRKIAEFLNKEYANALIELENELMNDEEY